MASVAKNLVRSHKQYDNVVPEIVMLVSKQGKVLDAAISVKAWIPKQEAICNLITKLTHELKQVPLGMIRTITIEGTDKKLIVMNEGEVIKTYILRKTPPEGLSN